jgi:hypothetical protein
VFQATYRPSSGAQKTVIAVSGFTCFWLPAAAIASAGNQKTYVKPETAITVSELLKMGGVSPETC